MNAEEKIKKKLEKEIKKYVKDDKEKLLELVDVINDLARLIIKEYLRTKKAL